MGEPIEKRLGDRIDGVRGPTIQKREKRVYLLISRGHREGVWGGAGNQLYPRKGSRVETKSSLGGLLWRTNSFENGRVCGRNAQVGVLQQVKLFPGLNC